MSDGAVTDTGLGKDGWSYLTFVVLLALSTVLAREAVATGYFPFEVLFFTVALILLWLLCRRVFFPVLRLRSAKVVHFEDLEAGWVEPASASQARASDVTERLSDAGERATNEERLEEIYAKMRIGSLQEAIAGQHGAGELERKRQAAEEPANPLQQTIAQRVIKRGPRRKRRPSRSSSQTSSSTSDVTPASTATGDSDRSTAPSDTASNRAKKSSKKPKRAEIASGPDSESDDDTFVRRWVERRRRIAAGADADAPTQFTSVSVFKKKDVVDTKF